MGYNKYYLLPKVISFCDVHVILNQYIDHHTIFISTPKPNHYSTFKNTSYVILYISYFLCTFV